jgi:uncharacterized damage-inducible protein DinB
VNQKAILFLKYSFKLIIKTTEMKNTKMLCLAFLLSFCQFSIQAQEIKQEKGFSPQIGSVVSMLEDLKRRVTNSVANKSTKEIDFLLDEEANRVGALILHLAATEKYYQLYTFENRGFNRSDDPIWDLAQSLGSKARAELSGKPIKYYLDIWDEVRAETLRLLKTKDDEWFKSKVKNSSMNNHWAWYHVMEHQANHMGQIRMILKRAK